MTKEMFAFSFFFTDTIGGDTTGAAFAWEDRLA
jgi:hypothetical protein